MYVPAKNPDGCAYCGEEIAPGEHVIDMDGIVVHEECFSGYMHRYAVQNGWKFYTYREDEE